METISGIITALRRALQGMGGAHRPSVGSAAIVLLAGAGLLAMFSRLMGVAEFQADPALPRAQIRVVAIPPARQQPTCPTCAVFEDWETRFAAAEARAQRRRTMASDQLSQMGEVGLGVRARGRLVQAEEHVLAIRAVRFAFGEAAADCGQGPVCRAQRDGFVDPAQDGCPPEFRPLIDEATRVARLTQRLDTVLDPCLGQGCPVVSCAPAHTFDDRLGDLEATLAAIMAIPLDSGDPYRDLLATPLGAETRRLVRSALRVPLAVPALFQPQGSARGAQSDTGLVGLAEEIAKLGHWADDLAARLEAAIDPLPVGRDGLWRVRLLSTRLWRLYEEVRAVVVARSERPVRRGPALHAAWDGFAQVLARLALDTLRMEADLKRTPPDTLSAHRLACRKRQAAPNRAMARGLALARARLSRCMIRAGCSKPAGGGAGASSGEPGRSLVPGAGLQTSFMDHLAAFDLDLEAAGVSLSGVTVAPSPPVTLKTDFQSYEPGEALRVAASGSNVCYAEPGALAIVVGPGQMPRGLETTGSARVRAGRSLGPLQLSERGIWIEAPERAGDYALKVFSNEARGGVELASVAFGVSEGTKGCRGFAGIWETDFGRLHVAVRDGAVRGSYRQPRAIRSGFLFGQVRNKTLTGVWRSEIGEGGTRLQLSADGKTFTGTWSHRPDRISGTGTWTGRCAGL